MQNHHLVVKYHQLVPQKELSLTDKVSLHDNLIIQGDNLKALKALLPTYAGKKNVFALMCLITQAMKIGCITTMLIVQ